MKIEERKPSLVNFQFGQLVKNIWEKSGVYSKIGKVAQVIKEDGKIEIRVQYEDEVPSRITRVYIEGMNLHHIVPYLEVRPISKKINRSLESCFLCGKLKPVNVRKDGHPICNNCYQNKVKPKEKCFLCGEVRPAKVRRNGHPICENCYRKELRAKTSPAQNNLGGPKSLKVVAELKNKTEEEIAQITTENAIKL